MALSTPCLHSPPEPALVVFLRWQMEEPQSSHETSGAEQQGLWQELRSSYPEVLQALRGLRKARTQWPRKTQTPLFTEGRLVSLRVLVACSRHHLRWDLLEGNLVLTTPLVGFIGRKSGTHRINRRQKEQVWKSVGTKGTGTLGLWNNLAGMLGITAATGFFPKMNPNFFLSFDCKDPKTKPELGATSLTPQILSVPWPPGDEQQETLSHWALREESRIHHITNP